MVPVLILLVVAGAVCAQPVDSLWSRTFGGTSYDYCYSVQETIDGGYILGGYTGNYPNHDITW